MATRKQKHQAALERREKFLEEERRRNEQVLDGVRDHRDRKHREMWLQKHDKNHSWQKIDKDCPHCQDRLRAQRSQQHELEGANVAS